MHKRRVRLLVLCCTLFALGAGSLIWLLIGKKNVSVGRIGDIPVTEEEYISAMNLHIAGITSRYGEMYEKSTPEEFWGTSREPTEPLAELHRETQAELIRRHMILTLAKEYGLIEDVDYESLRQALEEENEYRRDPERTEPIYGPVEYGFNEYLSYLTEDFTAELVTIRKEEGVISVTEAETEKFYNEAPQLLGSTAPEYVVSEARKEIGLEEVVSEQETDRIADILRTGGTFTEDAGGWNISEQTVDETNYREISRIKPEVISILDSLEEGEVSESLILGDTCYIYKMLERKEAKALPYEEIGGLYEKKLAEEKMEELIARRCEEVAATWKTEKLPWPGKE